MPLAFIDSQVQTGAADIGPRTFVPGIEPGGSRVGHPTKPALMIKNAWAELIDIIDAGTSPGYQEAQVRLKLSQETDLSPGLLLPVAEVHASKTGVAQEFNQVEVRQVFKGQGTIWAPRVVGLGVGGLVGGVDSLRWRVYIDYETVDIPWEDWFFLWDFLDNVTNDSFEY